MKPLQTFFGRHSDVAMVLAVAGILLVLFVPIPKPLLDFLILANFSFAFLILLLTFYVEKPVQFSTFPSLLLLATLFRLSLNVAATRLILTDGDAGRVISAVGSYVVAGNAVVGLIVFFILIVVQYVVVTSGAQRVSEVAARFTLDSMPGHQMSIDADLNMGFIDQAEAQRRRKNLEREAGFYARVVAATYFGKRFHDEIEFGDYLQYAAVGLLEAMERYDPQRGVQFRTFAARRMHGSILSGIERLTEKQQQIGLRKRLRAERAEHVRQAALDGAGGPATPEQLMKFVSDVGIGLAVCWMLEGTAMVDHPDAATSMPFYQSTELRQLRDGLLNAVEQLPAQERLVIRHHYLQEIPFDAIAASLQLTKGRISQVHKKALLHLRALLAHPGDWSVTL
jgi:RNA polymerase sigma factor (sigma-70 family)